MAKYHIDSNGKVGVCNAKTKPCPYGGNSGSDLHFESKEQAVVYADTVNSIINKIKTFNFKEKGYWTPDVEEINKQLGVENRTYTDIRGKVLTDDTFEGNEEAKAVISRVYKELGFKESSPSNTDQIFYYDSSDKGKDKNSSSAQAAREYYERLYDNTEIDDYLEQRESLREYILENFERENSYISGWDYNREDIIETSYVLDDEEVLEEAFKEGINYYDSDKLRLEDFSYLIKNNDIESVPYKDSENGKLVLIHNEWES